MGGLGDNSSIIGSKDRHAMSKIITLTMNPALDISTSINKVVHTDKLRCTAAKTQPGGGGINVARVITRLDSDKKYSCIAVYPVGGFTGQMLTQALDAEGIRSQPIKTHGDTRESFSVHETSSTKDFRFLLPGPSLSTAEWRACLDSALQVTNPSDILIASGSLPPGVPDEFLALLAAATRKKKARLVLDSSGTPLKLALMRGVFLFKPSLSELEELVGTTLSTEKQRHEAAHHLVTQGQAHMVALSLGEEGVLLVTPSRVLRAPAIPVEVISTVGAGDNFVAGFIWALQNQRPLDHCLAYGMASAAASVKNRDSNLCEPEVMQTLYPQAKVFDISSQF